jgi:hypothetical protein
MIMNILADEPSKLGMQDSMIEEIREWTSKMNHKYAEMPICNKPFGNVHVNYIE